MGITAVVFDVGRVLIDFQFESFRHFLVQRGAKISSDSDFIERTGCYQLERGLISFQEFAARVNRLLSEKAAEQEIARRWCDIFTPCREMLGLIPLIRAQCRVFLLSNTNLIHWDFLEEQYSLPQLVDGALTSHEAQLTKPDPEIFLLAERKFDLTKAETVFVDDIAKHVAVAETLGWKGIVHTSYQGTVTKLLQLGLKLESVSIY